MDSGLPNYVFYNPGGHAYLGRYTIASAVCNDAIPIISYKKQQNNCDSSGNLFSQSLGVGECKAYAESLNKRFCHSCGIKAWGKDGNGRPKGCFVGNGYPNIVFYNPGGDEYSGMRPNVSAVCY